jgi:uncharacterized peroxidase-related enzyme
LPASRHDERTQRSKEVPLVGGLFDFPGIGTAMMISPALAVPLRGLLDILLVNRYEGSTLSRADRELIATAVSAGNDCFYCMDTHGAVASVLLHDQGIASGKAATIVDNIKCGSWDSLSEKTKALIQVALSVRDHGRALGCAEVQRTIELGATDQDVQLAVLIAAAFCMFNRIVDGFRARTPSDLTAHDQRARHIAQFGYRNPPPSAIPAVASGATRKRK